MFRLFELQSALSVRTAVQILARQLLRARAILGVALLSFGLSPSKAAAATSGRTETLEAIHAVENPHDSMQPGRHGELGPYQFRRTTWRMHTRLPFEQALDRDASQEVAIRHYEWLKRGLVRAGMAPTSYNIALAWNGGLTATIRGRTSAASHHYAERVANLTQELSTAHLAFAR
jgi:hypothetical protein